MSVIKTEATFLTMIPTDSFINFPYNEPSIQNQPISINIKKESYSFDDEFYGSINPTVLANHQTYKLMNIKTEPDDTQSMQHSDTEILSQPLLSKIPDTENSIDLKLNQQTISIIKHESMDIKVESHNTSDSSPMTPDLETSLISIKDESYGQLENFEEVLSDEYLVKSGNTFCDICGKDFSFPRNLKRHYIETHLTKENYICDMCNKSFTLKSNLTRHIRTIHLKIRDWQCANCDKSFRTKSDLKQHEKTVHLKIRDWKCAHCDKSFGIKNSLKLHEKMVHLKIRDWRCNLCDKSFRTKGDLKIHEKIVHSKIRDWKCNHCNKFFSTKAHLKSHSRIHSSDSSEVCDVCHKSFRNLQSHKYLVHSERKRNFICNHCDKAFYTKADLNRHLVIHSDARDWKCKICEKNFKLKVILQKHEKIHLTNGSYI